MVIELVTAMGMHLFEWQKNAIRDIFAINADGNWAHSEAGILCARQNGKGKVLEAVAIGHLFLFPRKDNGQKTIIYTAHELKIAQDGFRRIRGYIMNIPGWESKLKISNAPGLEEFLMYPREGQLPGQGDRIKFIARTKNSGRGFPADVLILDEAQELAEEAMDSLVNVQTTAKNMQTIFTGTVPNPVVNTFDVFKALRDRGRANQGSEATLWLEYSPPGAEDYQKAPVINYADPQVWAEANPSLNVFIPYDNIAKMFTRSTSMESWGRERLSIWPNDPPKVDGANNSLDFTVWAKAQVQPPENPKGFSWNYAVSGATDGSMASICGATKLSTGQILIIHFDSRKELAWVPDELNRLFSVMGDGPVVGDGKNLTVIKPYLDESNIKWTPLNMDDVGRSYSMFNEEQIQYNENQTDKGIKIVHPGQPELTGSFKNARPRKLGNYGMQWWESDSTEFPETVAKAATLAYFAARTNNFKKKQPAIVRGW